MEKKAMFKDIINSMKELSRALDDIKQSIRVLDFKKLPKLLRKESKIIEKLEKYANTIKNELTDDHIKNLAKIPNILPFPTIVFGKKTNELLTIRQLYGELLRKVFIIGSLVEQHMNLYRMIYSNILSTKNVRPGTIFLDKKV